MSDARIEAAAAALERSYEIKKPWGGATDESDYYTYKARLVLAAADAVERGLAEQLALIVAEVARSHHRQNPRYTDRCETCGGHPWPCLPERARAVLARFHETQESEAK